jgi:hypothetical protein
MGGDSKIYIEPLDLDNYTTWSVRMQMLLIHMGLWAAVEAKVSTEGESDSKDHLV